MPHGGCKDEHVKVEQEPPEGGGIINGLAFGGGNDSTYN